MRTLALYAFSISAAAALLTGCGASESPFGAPAVARASKIDSRPGHGPTFIAKGAYARSLLYLYLESVNIYTYPRGKQLGSLGVGGSLCSDRLGNIVVSGAAGVAQVWVYPHGGSKPIAQMYNPANIGGCSVDPSSENIAVAGGFESLVIWPYSPKRGWGLAHQYLDPSMDQSTYCTYDSKGNLFIDGYTSSFSVIVGELPKGNSIFSTITLNHVVHKPGPVQWDDGYLAIEDSGLSSSNPEVIYRFAINGSSGREVSATTLTDSLAGAQFLIHDSTVLGPASYSSTRGLGFWRFPAGGAPVRIIRTYIQPYAEALSLK